MAILLSKRAWSASGTITKKEKACLKDKQFQLKLKNVNVVSIY